MCCNTMFLQSSSAYSQIRGSCMHHAMHRWTRCTRVAGSFRIKHKGSILRVMKARHEQVKHVHKCCAQLTWRRGVPSPTRATARRSIHEASTDACKLALLTYSGKSSRRAVLSVIRANITNVLVERRSGETRPAWMRWTTGYAIGWSTEDESQVEALSEPKLKIVGSAYQDTRYQDPVYQAARSD
jgi:hypothetical protein